MQNSLSSLTSNKTKTKEGTAYMPKRVFWPAALVVMGFIFMASNMGMLPKEFWNLWPVILVVVGLGGLLLSDKEDWDTVKSTSTKTASKPMAKKATKKRK